MAKEAGISISKLYKVCGIIAARVLVDQIVWGIQHPLPVCFCHSFMKQIVGLPVSYNDFRFDDPEFYNSTIKYILENDVSNLDLRFTDSIYTQKHLLFKEYNLLRGRSNLPVSNENKQKYIQRLTHFRLIELPEKNTEHFISGLFFYFYLFELLFLLFYFLLFYFYCFYYFIFIILFLLF